MTTIADMYRRVKMLNLRVQVPRVISRTTEEMMEIQRDQIYSGKDKFNQPISPFYRPKTIKIKAAKGQPTDRVTLKDTGSFYSGIQITKLNQRSFRISSSDKKNKKLEKKYGSVIFGLNGPSRAKYIKEDFFPELKEYIEKTLKVKMK